MRLMIDRSVCFLMTLPLIKSYINSWRGNMSMAVRLYFQDPRGDGAYSIFVSGVGDLDQVHSIRGAVKNILKKGLTYPSRVWYVKNIIKEV
jgi:hypothetical protein